MSRFPSLDLGDKRHLDWEIIWHAKFFFPCKNPCDFSRAVIIRSNKVRTVRKLLIMSGDTQLFPEIYGFHFSWKSNIGNSSRKNAEWGEATTISSVITIFIFAEQGDFVIWRSCFYDLVTIEGCRMEEKTVGWTWDGTGPHAQLGKKILLLLKVEESWILWGLEGCWVLHCQHYKKSISIAIIAFAEYRWKVGHMAKKASGNGG